ncbi:S8 family serine peptidase [bacterium]|nr:S8 family serine peptidase [bacterium]MBU1982926.1 S8 family serine peptidase [bacterium]
MNVPLRVFCLTVAFLLATVALAAEFSPALEAELAGKKDGDFVSAIVILESPIDIRALDQKLHVERASRVERYRTVVEALHYNAETTQPRFRAEFDQAMTAGRIKGYTPHWIENLFVISATKEFIESFRVRGDVQYVTENFRAELIEPVPSERADDPRGGRRSLDNLTIPPGIVAVGAQRVVNELGFTGQGVLVGNCDTGVDGTHPALASRWRGLHAPWYHCWMDNLGTNTTFPNDQHYHGTHVMGTITGLAISGSDSTWIGCAPRAEWIANNAINQSVNPDFDNDIILTFEWFTNPDSNIATMDDVPDVVQNSWGVNTSLGYVQCYDFWNSVILNCEAAGVVVTWSAGNESTSGLRSPAIYSINETQIFSVGAVDATNYSAPYPIASFSSRGPTPCTPYVPNDIKPEISAPGYQVWSAQPGGGYQNLNGTSMSGPHVAGVVALMREACPDCDPQTIKEALIATAIRDGYVTPPATENNTFGNGFIDAYNAVLMVSTDHGRVMGTVRDAVTLAPLPADVEVVGGPQRTTASPTGAYSLLLPSDSTYTLRFSYYGYFSDEAVVAVLTDDTTEQDMNLSPRPIVTAFFEDFESGAAGWTHDSPSGWGDQWHVSTERSYSATHSYKCGDTGTGSYANLLDARLTSPVIANLPSEARLSFYYQIEAERSSYYSDSAYDGGIIELSVDGGAFARVAPLAPGYSHIFRRTSGGGNPFTGPMPGQPCFSDTVDVWTEVAVDLSTYEGQDVQLRFRFGSDQSAAREGWYVDDVMVSGFGTGVPEVPTGLVIYASGDDLIFRWNADDNIGYRIYSDTDPAGSFSTLESQTTATGDTLFGAAASADLRFYFVRGWDGQ